MFRSPLEWHVIWLHLGTWLQNECTNLPGVDQTALCWEGRYSCYTPSKFATPQGTRLHHLLAHQTERRLLISRIPLRRLLDAPLVPRQGGLPRNARSGYRSWTPESNTLLLWTLLYYYVYAIELSPSNVSLLVCEPSVDHVWSTGGGCWIFISDYIIWLCHLFDHMTRHMPRTFDWLTTIVCLKLSALIEYLAS